MFTIVALSLCYQPHLRPTITTPRASTPVLSEQWSVDAIGKAIGNMAFEKTTDAMALSPKIDTPRRSRSSTRPTGADPPAKGRADHATSGRSRLPR